MGGRTGSAERVDPGHGDVPDAAPAPGIGGAGRGRRTCHLRFNDLEDPAPVPRGMGFATLVESDQPIIVQHTRLDSRQPANSIMTTIAHPL